jgi:hypothetical protein
VDVDLTVKRSKISPLEHLKGNSGGGELKNRENL